MKIIFLATPDIALESFDFFIKSPDYEVLALVTQKAKQAADFVTVGNEEHAIAKIISDLDQGKIVL